MPENENTQKTEESALTDYFIMEWVDIREKLPPFDEKVIVHFRGQGLGSIEIKYLPAIKAGYHHGWYPGGRDIESATHWMSLPPLPEG
jgi:hypothetical protein